MKLIDCRVYGFGVLSDYHQSFQEDVTTLLAPNGFGKSTLSAFLCAMFYGLPTARKGSDIEGSLRKRYMPWHGERFGGELTFSVGSRRYRVQRFFDPTTETRDRFLLLDADTGLESSDYPKELGQALFGVDETGFVRICFDAAAQLGPLPESIGQRLGDPAKREVHAADLAQKRLEDALRVLNGRNGKIEKAAAEIREAKNEMERCRQNIDEQKRLCAQLQQCSEAIDDLEQKKRMLTGRMAAAGAQEADHLRREQRRKRQQQIQELQEKLAAVLKRLGGRVPTQDALATLQKDMEEYRRVCEHHAFLMQSLNREDNRRILADFLENPLSEEQQISLRDEKSRLQMLRAQLSENERQCAQLRAQDPAADTQTLQDIQQLRERVQRAAEQKKPGRSVLAVLIIVAVLLLGAGAAGMFLFKTAGICLLSLGIVTAVSAGICAVCRRRKYKQGQQQRQALAAELAHCNVSPSDFRAALEALSQKAAQRQQLYSLCRRGEELARQEEACLQQLRTIVQPYGISASAPIQETLEQLQLQYTRYTQELLPQYEQARVLMQQQQQLKKRLSEALAPLGQSPTEEDLADTVHRIGQDTAEALALQSRLAPLLLEDETEAAEERKNSALSSAADREEPADVPEVSVQELQAALEECQKKQQQLTELQERLRQQIRQLDDPQAAYNEAARTEQDATETLECCRERAQILSRTQEFLGQIRDRLARQYTAGLCSAMERYRAAFGEDFSAELVVDEKLSPYFLEQGVGRHAAALSSGWQEAMDLCLRAALVEAVFGGEKPFLLLDDPFVHMDSGNFKKAAKLLKILSEKLQIVYLTCHPSRQIDLE